jgi:phosphatidylserine/phosphatidylglycerophosphate/cardiolipin synthase-like enzyme
MMRRSILLFLAALLAACEVVDIAVPPLTATRPVPAATGSGSWYRLYFTDPPDQDDPDNRPEDSIDDHVVDSINAAQRTVDAATFDFDLPSMADALIDAYNRGLIVRVVTDSDTLVEAQVQRLIEAGVPVVSDDRSALMHDKFVVVDGLVVWSGSWNFSQNDTYRNNNNVVGMVAPEIVANYQVVFEAMFEQGLFSRAPGVPYPEFEVEGTRIENDFSPDGGVAGQILAVLEEARRSIYFAAFSFTRDDFAQALIERAQAGVTVQGVFETRQVNAGSDEVYNMLGGAGLPVLLDGNRYTMHHKFFVVDEQIVVTGSYNFSNAAEENNNENVLIIYDAGIAGQYLQEFFKVWQKAGGG